MVKWEGVLLQLGRRGPLRGVFREAGGEEGGQVRQGGEVGDQGHLRKEERLISQISAVQTGVPRC